MNLDFVKKELKNFASKTNLQRKQPFNDEWEIYTNQYLPQPYDSLTVFLRVYFEKDSIDIELLRKDAWGAIDFLTDNFSYKLDENYTDEDGIGYCTQYVFSFNSEEKVADFLAVYQPYVEEILKK